MLLSRILLFLFIALVSARRHRKRGSCKPQVPLNPNAALRFNNGSAPLYTVSNGPHNSGHFASGGGLSLSSGSGSSHTTTTTSDSGSGASQVVPIGAQIPASFTSYGLGDSFGSGNCATTSNACSLFQGGHNAAASQNIFGVGPGSGPGPLCGRCFSLTMTSDATGHAISGHVVVKVNNLCPAQGNSLCAQSSLAGKNSLGGHVNFDLCRDDGAAGAMFGNTGAGLGVGHAVEVDCSAWSGGKTS